MNSLRTGFKFAAVGLMVLFLFAISYGGEMSNWQTDYLKLKKDYPGLKEYNDGQKLTRLYGIPFGHGSSPIVTAEDFRINNSYVFGITADNLMPESPLGSENNVQPVMYNSQTGQYKFTLVTYRQYQDGIPVYASDLRLLILNQDNYPLVLAASSLRDLEGFSAAAAMINQPIAESSVKAFDPGFNIVNDPDLVVWAGYNDVSAEPRVAIEVIADNGKPATMEYEKWRLLVDNQTGEILYTEDMIIGVDIDGTVKGMATQGSGADICDVEIPTGLPYARVTMAGGPTVYTDFLGNFTMPNAGDESVSLTSQLRGQWFMVNNQSGSNASITLDVVPPGPADFMHNETNTSEYNRSEVNSYLHANIVRDFVLNFNADYPGLDQPTFPVNVNLNDVCNAYYDYSSINFFRSGGGCANSGFSTVIYHEYGHHLVAMAGSGQGQYGEGMGDVMGVLIMDEPELAWGFFNNCNDYMRTANNNHQYPCTGEIHDCGQLISGCVWDTRLELEVTEPLNARQIIANLAVNAMLLHSGDQINPSITIDYLTLDDDDGNIDNGTPHRDEICTGFGAHNMTCPELVLIDLVIESDLPEYVSPDGGDVINVEVVSIVEDPEPGTAQFHYDIGEGWEVIAMIMSEPNVYSVEFPPAPCGITIKFYFSAETAGGELITWPSDAPNSFYATISADSLVTEFTDDFNDDLGWYVENSPGLADGAWIRGIPAGDGTRGDPTTDYDGSGWCYLTDNVPGNSDVDDGSTYLISPVIDLSEGDAFVKYALWYTNYFGDNPNSDYFTVYASNDGGSSWEVAQLHGPITAPGWTEHSFQVGDVVDPTGEVMLRFEASDFSNSGSVVEAAVDAVEIIMADCETGIYDPLTGATLPDEFSLIGSYPNPFNARVTISYGLPSDANVTLEIYDMLGRKVATLYDDYQQAGYHQVNWKADQFTSGVYFYRLKADDFTDTKKMMLLK